MRKYYSGDGNVNKQKIYFLSMMEINKLNLLFLWLSWMLMTGAGGTVVGALSGNADFFWFLFMSGLIVGVAQWVVLRYYIPHAGWWVLASAFGWVLGIFVSLGTKTYLLKPTAIHYFVIFALLGVAQWLVLRCHTQYAGWWVLVSAISGAAFEVVGSAVPAHLINIALPYVKDTTLPYGASWAGSGAVTGTMLVFLLQSRVHLN